jgi:hypothetical protein
MNAADSMNPNMGPTPWEFAFKPEFHDAPVGHFTTDDSLILTVSGRVMNKEMYHRLPEYSDWKGLMNGDLAILGRIDLDEDFLDLVVMDAEDGYLHSALVHRDTARTQPKEVRDFIDCCWKRAPIIRIYETLNKRSTK